MRRYIVFCIYCLVIICTSSLGAQPAPRKKVNRQRCPPLELKNGRVNYRSRQRIASFTCDRGYTILGEPYAACFKSSGWDVAPPVCIRSGCRLFEGFKNGRIAYSYNRALASFSCYPGFTLIGSKYAYCDSKIWNSTMPVCESYMDAFQCDFENENTCFWSHDLSANMLWRLHRFSASSSGAGSGPDHDHTLGPGRGGRYLYLEKSHSLPSYYARIFSPSLPVMYDDHTCFTFWYHMYGSPLAVLRVTINDNIMFEKVGNLGNRWRKGIVTIPRSRTKLVVSIEAEAGNGWTGNIAIDDLAIEKGDACADIIETASEVEKSCYNRCEETESLVEKNVEPCDCHSECYVNASCCSDYQYYCNDSLSSSTDTSIDYSTFITEDSSFASTDTTSTSSTEEFSTSVSTDEFPALSSSEPTAVSMSVTESSESPILLSSSEPTTIISVINVTGHDASFFHVVHPRTKSKMDSSKTTSKAPVTHLASYITTEGLSKEIKSETSKQPPTTTLATKKVSFNFTTSQISSTNTPKAPYVPYKPHRFGSRNVSLTSQSPLTSTHVTTENHRWYDSRTTTQSPKLSTTKKTTTTAIPTSVTRLKVRTKLTTLPKRTTSSTSRLPTNKQHRNFNNLPHPTETIQYWNEEDSNQIPIFPQEIPTDRYDEHRASFVALKEVNESSDFMMEFLITGAVLLLVASASLSASWAYRHRRRHRFRNEPEDGAADVLFLSSDEILDFTLARPADDEPC